jgi:hypothetical protein
MTKDANIIHLKLGGSLVSTYFSTSTPPKHTSHRQSRPIANDRFLNGEIQPIYYKQSVFDIESF